MDYSELWRVATWFEYPGYAHWLRCEVVAEEAAGDAQDIL